MQIADEHGWVQWALGGIAALGSIVTAYVLRMIGSVRRQATADFLTVRLMSESNRDLITKNTQDIAVNSALREESNRRYAELQKQLSEMGREIWAKLDTMQEISREERAKVNSRIDDILAAVRVTKEGR